MTGVNWAEVAKPYLQRYSDRNWKATFGVEELSTAKVWAHIKDNNVGVKPKHLLWLFHFWKVYDTEDVSCNLLKIDAKTFRLYVVRTLSLLQNALPELPFDYMQEHRSGSLVGIVDVTRVRVRKPTNPLEQLRYWSGKDKFCALKYEVVVSLSVNQRIVWCKGPVKGSVSDLNIFRKFLKHRLGDDQLIADLGYYDRKEPNLITGSRCNDGIPYTSKQACFEGNLNTVRQDIERVNARLKVFNINAKIWRGGSDNFQRHGEHFLTICKVLNIVFEDYPLTK